MAYKKKKKVYFSLDLEIQTVFGNNQWKYQV